MIRYLLPAVLLPALLLGPGVAAVDGCDTPVYRYAMYRWRPANYLIFYVHSRPLTDADKQLNQQLLDLEQADPPAPNLALYVLDFGKEAKRKSAPPPVMAAWEKQGKPQSTYLIFAPPPQGGLVYAGDLTAKDVKLMVDSPVRRKIGQLLEKGNASVFVRLEAPAKKPTKKPATSPPAKATANDKTPAGDKKEAAEKKAGDDANGAADKSSGEAAAQPAAGQPTADIPAPEPLSTEEASARTRKLVDGVNQGKIDLNDGPAADLGAPKPKAKKQPHKLAMLELRRDDPAEVWLVRMLLAVEPDLKEFAAPMVFAVYGRGRVYPPLIDAGISEDNLIETAVFLTGACSCTIKEQNPGVDLLMVYDWEGAAEAIAAKFGSEEGNEQLGASDLFPELIIPSSVGAKKPGKGDGKPDSKTAAASGPKAGPDGQKPETAASAVDTGKLDAPEDQGAKPASGEPGEALASADPETEKAAGGSPSEKGAEATQIAQQESTGDAVAETTDAERGGRRSRRLARADPPKKNDAAEVGSAPVWIVGGGVLAALVLLFAATFFVLRPR